MTTSLQARRSFVAAPDSLAPLFKRYPFLQEVAAAQQPSSPQRMRRNASMWPTDADARANEVLHAYGRTGGLASKFF